MSEENRIMVEIIDDGPCAHINKPFFGLIYGRNVESLKKLLDDMGEKMLQYVNKGKIIN